MKKLLMALGMVLGVSLGMFHAEPAKADTWGGITCNPQTGNAYPRDGHFYVCFKDQPGPELSVYSVFEHLPSNGQGAQHPGALELFKKANASLYYFANRSDAIVYTDYKYNGGMIKYPKLVVPNTVKCGYTGYDALGGLNAYIFDQCAYTINGKLQNVPSPALGGATQHESGHAYAFAITSNGPSRKADPSMSSGWKTLVDYDINTYAASLAVCTAFDGATPSDLEVQLGAAYQKPVCSGSTVLAPYIGQSTLKILQENTPYFTNPPTSEQYTDMWAEEWGHSAVPFMDYTIGISQLYRCSGNVIFALANYGRLPNAINQAYPKGCPVVKDTDITGNLN